MEKRDQAFKGYESWFNPMMMTVKMHLHILMLLSALQCVILAVIGFLFAGDIYVLLTKYLIHTMIDFQMPSLSVVLKAGKAIFSKTWFPFLLSFGVYALYPVILAKFKLRAKELAEPKYIRGSRLITSDELKEAMKRDGEKVDLPIGNAQLPVSAEPKHVFILGRPGVGKTVLLSQVIERIKERQDRAIIYDFKGDMVSRFYDPQQGDIIFNPLDTRCRGWNVFNEVETLMDIDAVAHSLIPHASQSDAFWNDAARDVFAGILRYLYANKLTTNRDIWNAVSAPIESISAWLKNTKGAERGYIYIQDASGKQALSVHAVLMQYVKPFEYMAAADGDFCINDWLESGKGSVFVTNCPTVKDTLKPILSLFVDLMGRKLLSLPDDRSRRVFFVIDEFGTLNRLSTITNLLTLSRSKGGSVWLGIQDVGQLDKLYTEPIRRTIVNACGTTVMFAVADADTAKFLSDRIGETEYLETEESHSMGVEDNRDGISVSQKKKTERLVLPAQIMEMKELTAYLKVPNYNLTTIQLKPKDYTSSHEPLLIRPDLHLENIVEAQAEIPEEAEVAISQPGEHVKEEKESGTDRAQEEGNEIWL